MLHIIAGLTAVVKRKMQDFVIKNANRKKTDAFFDGLRGKMQEISV